jgi:hypothetical protein
MKFSRTNQVILALGSALSISAVAAESMDEPVVSPAAAMVPAILSVQAVAPEATAPAVVPAASVTSPVATAPPVQTGVETAPASSAATTGEAGAASPVDIAAERVPSASPEANGLTVVTHPGKQAVIKGTPGMQFMVYRVNPSMPEITNEDLIRGRVQNGRIPDLKGLVLGYLPMLSVRPCAVGCKGPDYVNAATAFLVGYGSAWKSGYQPRGVLPVRVRWYKRRSFIERVNPLAVDEFGISFVLEGKLVSVGVQTSTGSGGSVGEVAYALGNQLALSMSGAVAMGAKPGYLDGTSHNALVGAVGSVLDKAHNFEQMLGVSDVRLRLEPVTTENSVGILPAIDGVLPGEVLPITEVVFPPHGLNY